MNNKWHVLANKRGEGTPDFQGYWNCPCGYLDYNETTEEAAIRETLEETGLILDEASFFEFDDSPKSNLQNVTFMYYSVVEKPEYSIEKSRGGEEKEVDSVKWIPISEIDNFIWAFNHDRLIKNLAHDLRIK